MSIRGKGLGFVIEELDKVEASQVQALDASHNSVENLNFTQLSELTLSDNLVRNLSGIESLKNLRRIGLSSNKITQFEELQHLRKLEILDLSYNAISSFAAPTRLRQACVDLKELYVHGNPGSKCKATLSRLVGFRSLTNISVGVTTVTERQYLIQANPLLLLIDGKPVQDSERDEATSMNPEDLFKSPDTAPVLATVPDLTVIEQLNGQILSLKCDLVSSQNTIAKYESDKRDYAEYVSLNLLKLTEYIEKSKRERASERLYIGKLEQQVNELKSECEQLQATFNLTERDRIRETSANQEVQEQQSAQIRYLESKLAAATKHSSSVAEATENLHAQTESKNQKIQCLIRQTNSMSRYMEELLNIVASSCEQRRKFVGTIGDIMATLGKFVDDLAVIEDVIRVYEKIREERAQSLKDAETSRAILSNQMEDLRIEYAKSVSRLDESVRKKISKYEEALRELHASYESEKNTRSGLEVQVAEFGKLQAAHRIELERAAENAKTKIERINQQMMGEKFTMKAEAEAKLESAQRKLEAREKDLVEITDTLDKLRTSLRVKEEVVLDLSSQIRELKAQVLVLEEERDSVCSSQIECFKREIQEHAREAAYLKRQLEEAESTIQQKEQLVQYVSSEISGIKESYEAKLSSQEVSYNSEISKMKHKLGDAARALLELDKLVKDREKENECLRLKLDDATQEKARLEKLNSQKISQIKCILGETVS